MMINWDVFIDKYEAEHKQIDEDSKSIDKFIKNGVVIDKVRGTFTRKNYVLSLRK